MSKQPGTKENRKYGGHSSSSSSSDGSGSSDSDSSHSGGGSSSDEGGVMVTNQNKPRSSNRDNRGNTGFLTTYLSFLGTGDNNSNDSSIKNGSETITEEQSRQKDINDQGDSNAQLPLPDAYSVAKLAESIGKKKNWTSEQIKMDIKVLESERLSVVADLRQLDAESWREIKIPAILKSVLRSLIMKKADYNSSDSSSSSSSGSSSEFNEDRENKKKEKKLKKKMKKREKKMMKKKKQKERKSEDFVDPDGSFKPVSEKPILFGGPSYNVPTPNETRDSAPALSKLSNKVNLSSENKDGDQARSQLFSSVSSFLETKYPVNNNTSSSNVSGALTPCPADRLRLESGGKVYEYSRYCPHKGADLAGAPVSGTVITCPKHKWKFDLAAGGNCMTKSGYSLQSCVMKGLEW